MTREDVVLEARRWLGTPFHHQGRLFGVGVDCVGLIFGVRAALGLPNLDRAEFKTYGRRPPRGAGMLKHFDETCGKRLERWVPGDILVFWISGVSKRAQHCGIATDRGLIHAVGGGGVAKVVEHTLSGSWVERLICAYAMPGVS